MAHRPYPNADRSLRQIDRHRPSAPTMPLPDCLRPLAASLAQLRVYNQRAAEQTPPVDEYRLSTRRPTPAAPTGLRD
ncbi:hypothetical protein ABT150_23655 [Streptomyces mirabilis]|uniref:hypothetical protein n=1 Tax=Streptomyces mirabilis TaxID=68239 RepID=UPI00332F8DB3